MTIAAIHQPQYLPYLGFFHKVLNADVFVVLDNVEYHRRGLQNRNRIKASSGVHWLTVPVLQREGQLISQVMINPFVQWRRQHWAALQCNYGRAPFFDHYGPSFKALLDLTATSSLCNLNLVFLRWAMDALGITTPIVTLSMLGTEGKRSELLLNLCKAVGADTYLSGPGGRRYMDLEVFSEGGVAVLWQEFKSPVYTQLWPEHGFIPDLSFLDALFLHGPNVRDWLI